jgi:uncharacterized membrane protein YdjX (TVP38/TMEM64 family)
MQRLASVKTQVSDDLVGVQLGRVDSGRAPSRGMGRITPWLNVTAVLLSLLLLALYWRPVAEMLRIIADRQAVVAYLEQFGPTAPILFIIIMVFQVIVAAIPGHALLFASGYIYGFAAGFWLNYITVILASQAAYLIARWAGRPVVERLTPVDTLNRLHTAANEKGVFFFMFAFMLPIFPADVLNYAAGLSGISAGRFFVANAVGRIPLAVVCAAVGAYGFELSGQVWVVILIAAVIMFLLWHRFLAAHK